MVPDVEEEWSSVAAPPVSGAVPVISGSGEDNTDVSDLPKSTIEYYTNIEQVRWEKGFVLLTWELSQLEAGEIFLLLFNWLFRQNLINLENRQVLERDEFDNEADRSLLEEKLLDQITSDGITKILYHWDGSRYVKVVLC